jgi:hypothetical protein
MSLGTSRNSCRGITLMELIIALVLLCLLVMGISNIDAFCRSVFLGADRKAKTVNEVSYVVEHMGKQIGMAVGDANNTPVVFASPPAYCTKAAKIWTDNTSAMNGIYDGSDRQIMYCFNNTSHSITYYSDFLVAPGTFEELSHNVLSFDANLTRNTVDVNITGCWNPGSGSGAGACGTPNNPSVTLQTRIVMPSVSINATM